MLRYGAKLDKRWHMQQRECEMLGLSPCALWVSKRQEVSLVCQCGPWPNAPEAMLLWHQHLQFVVLDSSLTVERVLV